MAKKMYSWLHQCFLTWFRIFCTPGFGSVRQYVGWLIFMDKIMSKIRSDVLLGGRGGFMENVVVTFSIPKSIYEWPLIASSSTLWFTGLMWGLWQQEISHFIFLTFNSFDNISIPWVSISEISVNIKKPTKY